MGSRRGKGGEKLIVWIRHKATYPAEDLAVQSGRRVGRAVVMSEVDVEWSSETFKVPVPRCKEMMRVGGHGWGRQREHRMAWSSYRGLSCDAEGGVLMLGEGLGRTYVSIGASSS